MPEGVIDVDALLEPIAGDNPAGTDLRADSSPLSLFQQIKDRKNKARQMERDALYGPQMQIGAAEEAASRGKTRETPADCWRLVKDKGVEVLANSSKDLEVAAYLAEALLRLDGFAGFRDGMRVVRGLIERFWDHVYPRPDEDGLETTILPITRLDSEVLTVAIKAVPLTQGSSTGPYAAWQFRQSEDLKRCSPEERQTRIDRGAVTKEMVDRAARETSTTFFQDTYDQLGACSEELSLLSADLNERCPELSPTFSGIEEALSEAQSYVSAIAGPRLKKERPAEPTNGGGGEGGENGPDQAVDKMIKNREDAFSEIERIAQFFEQIDPQSLIPAQLRKVIRWGRMSPAQFYSELIKDSSARDQVFDTLGIKPAGDSDGESLGDETQS